MNREIENLCCWGCESKIASEPEALTCLLTNGTNLRQLASDDYDFEVEALKSIITREKWQMAKQLAVKIVNATPRGTPLPALHDRIGQIKKIVFSRCEVIRPLGMFQKGQVLEVLSRHHMVLMVEKLFSEIAAESVEPNLALGNYRDLDVKNALESAIIFMLKEEKVRVVYPTRIGHTVEVFQLPGTGSDVFNLMRRVSSFLHSGTVVRWRTVILDNICGIGTPLEADQLPSITQWIYAVRGLFWYRRIWLVLGISVPDENPYNRMTGDDISRMMNNDLTMRNVKVVNFCDGRLKKGIENVEMEPQFRNRAFFG